VLKEVVKQLRTRVIEDGTAIGDAIAVSLNRLRDSDAKSKVIVLITDGDNNAGKISPLDAAAMAKSLHIPVFTVLVGKGGRVPFPDGTDLFGNPTYREMDIAINPELLKAISAETGGQYYRATDRESLQSGLRSVLDRLDKSKLLEGGAMANMREEFPPFLLAAFLLAALELLLRLSWLRVFP
jgi:Ca-activated chloride channel homolog